MRIVKKLNWFGFSMIPFHFFFLEKKVYRYFRSELPSNLVAIKIFKCTNIRFPMPSDVVLEGMSKKKLDTNTRLHAQNDTKKGKTSERFIKWKHYIRFAMH